MDAIPHIAATTSHAPEPLCAAARRRQNYIQCSQCTEMFARHTTVCPRCNRMNDRSLVIRGFQFLALCLVVCAVTWVVRIAASFSGMPASEPASLRAYSTPASSDQPELKF